MESTTQGLLLEQWRQSRGPLAAAAVILAVSTGVTVFFYSSFLPHFFLGGPEAALAPAWLAVLMAFGSLFVYGTARDIRFTFPRRLFTLPVSTTTLVTIPLLYKLAAISVFALVLGGISQGLVPKLFPFWFPLVVFLVLTAWAQAYVCLVTAVGFARATVLVVVLLVGFSAVFILPLRILLHGQHWNRFLLLSRERQLVLAGASFYVAAAWGVSCARLVRRLPEARVLALAAPFAVGVLVLLIEAWVFLLVPEAISLHVAFLGACPIAVLLMGFPPIRSVLAFILFTALAFICCEIVLLWLDPDECMGVLITTGLVVSAWLVSIAAISGARHGDHALAWKGRSRRLRALQGRLDSFRASPLGVQMRFEWRNTARYMPLLTGVGLLATVCLCLIYHGPEAKAAAFVFGNLLPAVVGCGVGFYLERCSRPYLAFAATRPVSVGTLARAKILAGGAAVAVSLVPVAVIWMLGAALASELLREMLQMQARQLLLLAGTMILGAWGGMMVGRLSLALLVLAYAAFLAALPFGWVAEKLVITAMPEAMGAVLAGGVIAALFAINAVLRFPRLRFRRIVSPIILVFLVGTCAAHWLASTVPPPSRYYRHADFYFFYLVPLIPFLALVILHSVAQVRGLISSKRAVLSLVAYLALGGAVFWLFRRPAATPYDWEHLYGVGVGLGLVWAPFVWMPLTVQWQRHR